MSWRQDKAKTASDDISPAQRALLFCGVGEMKGCRLITCVRLTRQRTCTPRGQRAWLVQDELGSCGCAFESGDLQSMALGLSLLPQIQGFYRLLFLGFAERGHAMPLPSDSEAPKPWPWPRETAKAGLSSGAFDRPQSRCGGGSKVIACSQPVWSLEHG